MPCHVSRYAGHRNRGDGGPGQIVRPLIHYPIDFREGAFDLVIQPGMMLGVEALIGQEGCDVSIKLEDQVPITETGVENLTNMRLDPRPLR